MSRLRPYTFLLMTLTAMCVSAQNLPDGHYLTNLRNYTFKNTRGIADTPHKLKSMRVPENHEDPDPWTMPTDADLKALKDRGININFPNFTFDTVGDMQFRQRTHTVEHVVYAIPGDAISLYPYYGLDEYYNFNENFSHWYDFNNGGRVKYSPAEGNYYDLLSFPTVRGDKADHDLIQISDDYGFYGGVYMSPGTKNSIYDGYPTYEVNTADEFIDAVETINNSASDDKTRGIILINADLDFNGKTNVPMLGYDWHYKFCGVIEGNGHMISNLTYNRGSGTGLIGCSGDYAVVRNLYIDNTCSFTGTENVGGVVGFHAPSSSNGGSLTITSVRCDAQVKGTNSTNRCAGGLIGACNEPATLTISNCYVGATIGVSGEGSDMHNAALIAWWQNKINDDNHIDYSSSKVMLKNVVVNCTLYGSESGREYIRHCREGEYISTDGEVKRKGDFTFIGCYGNINNEDECWTARDGASTTSPYSPVAGAALPVIDGWNEDHMTPPVAPSLNGNNGQYLLDHNIDNRNTDNDHHCKAGTSGVFFFPMLDGVKELPQEYVIAADYSQTFQLQNHVDVDNMEITEPLIAIRHIFRVKDGKAFADKVSGSLEQNREYIRKNRRFVTARAEADFQIRLQFPLPTDWGKNGGVTNFYYKTSDEKYLRIKQFGIRVLDGDTHKLPDSDEWAARGFEFGADIKMYRAKASGSGLYPENDGNDEFAYHTMLTSGSRSAGHYIVQVIGKDDSGNPISLSGKSETDYLVMMEYDITFVPSTNAFLVTEAQLYDSNENNPYKKGQDANLKKKYGEPIQKIDFDEYAKINKIKDNDALKKLFLSSAKYKYEDGDRANPYYDGTTSSTTKGMEKTFFKWPVLWDRSSYSFGYNYRHDYNMYMLATHSDNVPYHAEADKWTGNVADDGNGLFDRLYYKTKRLSEADSSIPVEQGYFYYVNAATDPGVSARLDFKIPCPGYRVVVSAWVAEFSPIANAELDEASNISFNFVAVMKNGDRITLHNFITGYLPKTGEWLNVYYSFVPRLSEFYPDSKTFDDVEHFELELAHNGKKSSGADYAIDDIRAYVIPPSAEAKLPDYLCGEDPNNVQVTLTTSFEALMQTLGLPESYTDDQTQFDLYYAFVDKSEFDRKLEKTDDASAAFAAAVVNLSEKKEEVSQYGNLTVDSYYKGNESILNVDNSPKTLDQGTAYRNETENGERLITFVETLPPGALRPGKEYYVAYKSSLGEGDAPDGDLGTFFDITGECAYRCVIYVTANNVVKIDGVIQTDANDITVCENQSPAIQVNVRSKKEVNGAVKEVKNARFDWFNGTLGEFEEYSDGDEKHTLKFALQVFRAIYSDAESLTGITAGVKTPQGDDTLAQWMIDLIRRVATPDPDNGLPMLTLYQASFVLPQVDLDDEEESRKVYVTAIPIPDYEYDDDYDWCLSPTEVGVTIENHTPILRHGLKNVAYPSALQDVPLRVGLEQLYAEVNASDGSRTLEIPVRLASSTNERVGSLELKESAVVLVQTNDPEYRHIGTLGDDNKEIESLLWVGEISQLTASTAANADGNLFKASFDKDFRFKEGYFYRLRFNFEEKKEEVQPDEDAPVVCSGQDVFTLKIVPKYLLWRGGENLNFNNDANWMRVHTDTLSAPAALADASERHRHFATNGANGNRQAYAPLDFTYVVLKGDVENPYLYNSTARPSDIIGSETPLIRYDMAGYLADAAVKCKAWYANTCKEIHFRPGATIMNQQELKYEKAWVDMELDHSRWYTLSSPFKETFAGDFYLPSAGARQATELFQPITFDNKLEVNDRFRPAVYQRGWDKAVALVYELDARDNEKGTPRNVAIKTFWSHVYNDVKEQYGGGTGFSIKTDVSEMSVNKPGVGDKVLFRLPKADTEYWYFKKDRSKDGHHAGIDRSENHYRLNDGNGSIKASTATEGQYFLVGNPFMTHMDIQEFLKENSGKIEQKFWIVTEAGQTAGNSNDDVSIAPMQGFFVKARTAATSLSLDYNETMMRRYGTDGNRLTGTTRSEEAISSLRITAYNDGIRSSETEIRTPDFAEGCDVEAIDNRDLDIPSLVYVVKEGRAMSICHDYFDAPMELGVLAPEGISTTLLFEGVDESEGLLLYDKMEDDYTPLTEGMQLDVDGTSAGRLFITRDPLDNSISGEIEVKVGKGCLTAIDGAATGILNVTVYDLPGRIVASKSTDSNTLSVHLPAGVYVAEVNNGSFRKAVRIVISD